MSVHDGIEATRLGYHAVPARVQFGWVDTYGMLWHGHALSYFEQARADIVRKFDLPAHKLFDLGMAVPMVDLDVRYVSPARDDDELEIRISLLKPRLPLPYLLFEYRIHRVEDGAEVLRGRTRQMVIRNDGRVLIRLPKEVRTCLDAIWAYLDTCPRWDDEDGAVGKQG